MKELPIELQSAKEFHSHLGPYLVVGLKMGRFLTEEMDTSPLRITSYTGSTPPVSCLIDGLQLSTPCTVGNGGISIREQGEARVEGKGEGRKITLTLLPEVEGRIKTECTSQNEEELALWIWQLAPEEIFSYEEF